MSAARYIIGDTRDVVASLPDASVDLVMTSPPFLALRSYLPVDHPDKWREIGSEPTPAEFLQTLLELTADWRRVLAPHGSIAVELGDTYCGARGYGNAESQNPAYGERSVERWEDARVERRFKKADDGWPMDKSICGIPWLYALSLAYGRNMLTGQPSPAGQWRVRNVVAWCRPNPPVGALGDKYRPATSYITVATIARDRYFDLDAVRVEPTSNHKSGEAVGNSKAGTNGYSGVGRDVKTRILHPAGAPPLDYWVIPTAPYSGSHYATYPPDLCTRPILSMCPQRVCTVCGQPSRRIVETTYEGAKSGKPYEAKPWGSGIADGRAAHSNKPPDEGARMVPVTLGWTECECPGGETRWRNGLVLDPFGGSGTTGMVATGHGRDAILVDIDDRNAALAAERIGMFLTVEHHTKDAA